MSTTSAARDDEADVILNRVNLALAKSRRLIASWVPPQSAEELANTKTEEELEREEQQIFTPVPDTLGLGAPPPKTNGNGPPGKRAQNLTPTERLRKQLLGNSKKQPSIPPLKARGQSLQQQQQQQQQPFSKPSKHNLRGDGSDAEDEDEGGRSSLGKKKKKQKRKTTESRESPDAKVPAAAEPSTSTSTTAARATGKGPGRKAGISYLDEVLSSRPSKARRRKKKGSPGRRGRWMK